MIALSVTRPSIARRLLVSLLLAYFLVWIVVVAIAGSSLYATGSGDFDQEMSSVADVALQAAEESPATLLAVLHGIALKLEADGKRAGVPGAHVGFQVHDRAGDLVAHGGANSPDMRIDDAQRDFFEVQDGSQTWRVLRRLTGDGALRIDITQSLQTRVQIMRANLLSPLTLVQMAIGIPLLGLPIWLAVRTGLSPLLRLSETLSARESGELEPIRTEQPYHELTPLIAALNDTLSRLSELLRRERAFLADAAHELRTPLAVISAQYDTLQQAPGESPRDEAMQRLGLGVTRSVRLVNQLLALARLEADVESHPIQVDLADLVRDCLAMHAAAAHDAGVELSFHGRDSLVTVCTANAVDTIVHNLVSNAIRHGRRGGQVEVTLGARHDQLFISVRDDGPGLAVDERQRVFERFWRGARSANQSAGSGLGMAIVMAASRQLHGRIELEAGIGGAGLGVSLTWSQTDRAM